MKVIRHATKADVVVYTNIANMGKTDIMLELDNLRMSKSWTKMILQSYCL